MNIVGIDPGKNGAIAVFSPDGVIQKTVIPTIGTTLDIHGLHNLLLEFARLDTHAYIENVHAIYGSAAGATFDFGFTCGVIQGIVCALNIPYTLVQPKEWQRRAYVGIPEIRKPDITIKKGKRIGQKMQGARDCKKMSLLAAKRLFPKLDLRRTPACKNPHDGIVDALLIAYYGTKYNDLF